MAEAAGIALAVFPLIIKGLDAVVKVTESLKKWFEYHKRLRHAIRALKMEETKFRNTLTKILRDTVYYPDLKELLEKPGEDLWRNETFKISFQAELGSSFDDFDRAISHMTATFNDLKVLLDLDHDYAPQWLNLKAHKRQWKKLKFTLRDRTIKEHLNDLDKINKDIEDLVGHSQYMSTTRPRKTAAHAKKYEDVRKHAKTLYNALKHTFMWPCGCTVPHSANLCLEYRVAGTWGSKKQRPRFKVLFSFETGEDVAPEQLPWDWRETRIEPFEPLDSSASQSQPSVRDVPQIETMKSPTASATANTNTSVMFAATGFSLATMGGHQGMDIFRSQHAATTNQGGNADSSSLPARFKRVSFASDSPETQTSTVLNPVSFTEENVASQSQKLEDLCKAILNAKENSCLGLLSDEQERCHLVSTTDISSQRAPVQTTSLQDVFMQTILGRKERLVLGIKIASALLQLHGTPWLVENWSKADIRFRRQHDGVCSAILSQPFLSKSFVSPTCQSKPALPKHPASSLGIRNQGIFALGLILTELWFGKPIDHLRETMEVEPLNQAFDTTNFATTTRLLDLVYDEAGTWYGDAVRRCINCDFDQRYNTLDKEGLKEAVHAGVIAPLEQNLEAFCGGSLEGVLA